MAEKLDYKKQYKDLYLPGQKPMVIDVPAIPFVMVDGVGAPEGENYQAALQILYSIAFTIKFSKMKGPGLPGYFEYVMPPLEGFWGKGAQWDTENRATWQWASAIRLPAFVTPKIFGWAVKAAAEKNAGKGLNYHRARFETLREGLCVQMMHVGPYSTEGESIAKLHAYMQTQNLVPHYTATRRHHEIYLGDPRKTAPEKRRTVLRLPTKKKEG